MTKRKIIVEAICILFILLFIYASVIKLLEFEKFKSQIGASPLLTSYSGFIAWFIPSLEIIISLMLAIRQFRIFGIYASFTLMVIFTGYIIAILNFSDFVPCSCGGILEKMTWGQHLVFNIIFILLSIIGIVAYLPDQIAPTKSETRPQYIKYY